VNWVVTMLLRHKSRYILVETSREIDLNDRFTFDDFEDRLAMALGELNYADANPKIAKQYNKKVFIIRTNRGQEPKVILSLALMKEINKDPIGFYTISTSGTIRTVLETCKKLYN
jgi:RNase P/RNase MRP subunit POP5